MIQFSCRNEWLLRFLAIGILTVSHACSAERPPILIQGIPIRAHGIFGVEISTSRSNVIASLKKALPLALAFCINSRCEGDGFFVLSQSQGIELTFSFSDDRLVQMRAIFSERLTEKEHTLMISRLTAIFGAPRREGYGFWDNGDQTIVLLPSSITFNAGTISARRVERTTRLRVHEIE